MFLTSDALASDPLVSRGRPEGYSPLGAFHATFPQHCRLKQRKGLYFKD
jgi:hypothetical protein